MDRSCNVTHKILLQNTEVGRLSLTSPVLFPPGSFPRKTFSSPPLPPFKKNGLSLPLPTCWFTFLFYPVRINGLPRLLSKIVPLKFLLNCILPHFRYPSQPHSTPPFPIFFLSHLLLELSFIVGHSGGGSEHSSKGYFCLIIFFNCKSSLHYQSSSPA